MGVGGGGVVANVAGAYLCLEERLALENEDMLSVFLFLHLFILSGYDNCLSFFLSVLCKKSKTMTHI